MVRQVESLGGEVISGTVCSVTRPFAVTSTTPRVSFVFLFSPISPTHGHVGYAYSIRSANEHHDAKGSYTLSGPDPDGTLHLALKVSDHVVFKGFDGNIPVGYRFDLVPSGEACTGS